MPGDEQASLVLQGWGDCRWCSFEAPPSFLSPAVLVLPLWSERQYFDVFSSFFWGEGEREEVSSATSFFLWRNDRPYFGVSLWRELSDATLLILSAISMLSLPLFLHADSWRIVCCSYLSRYDILWSAWFPLLHFSLVLLEAGVKEV